MPSDEKIERMLEQVGNAAVVLAEGIRDHNRPSEVFQALLDTLGAVVKEEVPDPADLTTYASALLLQKENEKLHECVKVLRRALSRVQFYWPERGRVFAICLGCGAALDVGHADDCEINNALNPKPAEPIGTARRTSCNRRNSRAMRSHFVGTSTSKTASTSTRPIHEPRSKRPTSRDR